jgi:hypothetical protein
MMAAYWEKKLIQARNWVLSATFLSMPITVKHFLDPFNEYHVPFSRFYFFSNQGAILLLAASFLIEKWKNLIIKAAFFLHFFFLSVRSLDFEGSKD